MAIFIHVMWFLAGVFFANAVPHLVSGLTGKSFQTPFAEPPGIGLSSSRINILWAFANLIVGWFLLSHFGRFSWRSWTDAGTTTFGALAIAMYLASHFGKLHGGNIGSIAD